MKLPKRPEMREWQENPETKAFVRALKAELAVDLFQALKRACRSTSDPVVKEAWARYNLIEELVTAVEGKSHDDQPGDGVQ